jgi:hypothetical protein
MLRISVYFNLDVLYLSAKCLSVHNLLNHIAALHQKDCWLEVSIRKVLRPATSTQVFLGFPMPLSKC